MVKPDPNKGGMFPFCFKVSCWVGCAKKRVGIRDAFWFVVEKLPSLFRKVGGGAGPFCRLGVLHGMAPKNVF